MGRCPEAAPLFIRLHTPENEVRENIEQEEHHESRISLAWALVGGFASALVLTLATVSS